MKKYTLFLALIAVGIANILPASAQRSLNDPMTQAILAVYADELRENPGAYDVLLSRADEYNRHGEYLRALADLDQALQCIPASAPDAVLRARTLRALVNKSMGRGADALADLEAALLLAPESAPLLALKAQTEFDLGQISEAKSDYQRLMRVAPHSQDAYIGLAAVAVRENNLGIANELLERAVALDPNNANVYMRRAEVRTMMGNHNGAVDDLVLAISINPADSRPLNRLVDYASTNYPAAMNGLSAAVAAVPDNGMFRYLRAGIAQGHYHYLAALDDYNTIVARHLYDYPGIQAAIAQCLFALGRYDQALDNIDYALARDTNKTDYYTLRSKILRALGRNQEAVSAAAQAIAVDRENGDALAEMALAYTAAGQADQANALLGEAMLNDAENPVFPMLRAWLAENYLANPAAATQYYNMVADMDHFYAENPRSLKGFALYKLGQHDQARAWIDNILATADDHDGSVNYYAACMYNLLGDTDKALECTNRALDKGYADWHNWNDNADGIVNPGTLRDDLRFLNALSRRNHIFGR